MGPDRHVVRRVPGTDDELAVLYSLVGSCIAAGVTPEADLADVLHRVQTHRQSAIDDRLPLDRKTLFGQNAAG